MRYALVDIDTAKGLGLMELTHISVGGKMIINENEMLSLAPTLAEAEAMAKTRLISEDELNEYKRKFLY